LGGGVFRWLGKGGMLKVWVAKQPQRKKPKSEGGPSEKVLSRGDARNLHRKSYPLQRPKQRNIKGDSPRSDRRTRDEDNSIAKGLIVYASLLGERRTAQ